VLLNEQTKFQTNELLTECLALSFDEPELQTTLFDGFCTLEDLMPGLDKAGGVENYYLLEHVDFDMILGFDALVRRLAKIVERLDQYELSLPPYNHLSGNASPSEACNRVFQILNRYPLLWKIPNGLFPELKKEADSGKYIPLVLLDPFGYPADYYGEECPTYSVPVIDFQNMIGELHDLFKERRRFFYHYMDCIDMIRNLLDKYLNVSGHFQTEAERSAAIARYEKENPDLQLSQFFASELQIKTKVIQQDGKPVFTEHYVFQDALSFLFVDLMRGMDSNYLPKRCSNCGRWFLLTGGKYLEYCSRPLESDPNKTCRDVGAQESYTQKCKNDPIWQTYQRAYKTHFARRKKGKMTPDEFRVWADNAIIWRGQAERGELDFDTYYTMIRK
jgi:hypothetical protein